MPAATASIRAGAWPHGGRVVSPATCTALETAVGLTTVDDARDGANDIVMGLGVLVPVGRQEGSAIAIAVRFLDAPTLARGLVDDARESESCDTYVVAIPGDPSSTLYTGVNVGQFPVARASGPAARVERAAAGTREAVYLAAVGRAVVRVIATGPRDLDDESMRILTGIAADMAVLP